MEKPKFRVPLYFEKRTGRITIFLASVAAISYLITRFSRDYQEIYEHFGVAAPPVSRYIFSAGSFIREFWWIVALGTIMVTLLLIAITKTGTFFTILGILTWLAGAASYLALWLPVRGMNMMIDGS